MHKEIVIMMRRDFSTHNAEQIVKIFFTVNKEIKGDAQITTDEIVEQILQDGIEDYDEPEWDYEDSNWDDEPILVPEKTYSGIIKLQNVFARGIIEFDETSPRMGEDMMFDDEYFVPIKATELASKVMKTLHYLASLDIVAFEPTVPEDADLDCGDWQDEY